MFDSFVSKMVAFFSVIYYSTLFLRKHFWVVGLKIVLHIMRLPSFNIYIQRRYGYLMDTVLCSIFKLKESIFLRQVPISMMRSNRVEITLINFEKSRSIVRIVDAINSKLHFSKEKISNLCCSNQYALMMAERNVLWQKLQISGY